MEKSAKNKALLNLILTIFFGWFGYYRLSKNQIGLFVLWLLTCGLFGIGWIIDIIFALIDYLNVPSYKKTSAPVVASNTAIAGVDYSRLELYRTYDYVELFCKGDIPTEFENIQIGEKVDLQEDENNIHDSETIEVYTKNYNFVGYMYNNTLRAMMHKYIDITSEYWVESEISDIKPETEKVYLNIKIYKVKIQPTSPKVYILNPTNKKIHCPNCSTLKSAKNLKRITNISEAKKQGYTSCGICKPF